MTLFGGPFDARRLLLGAGLVCLGAAILFGTLSSSSFAGAWSTWARSLVMAAGGVLLAGGGAILATQWSGAGTSSTLFHLDHFLPFLRRTKPGQPTRPPGLMARAARRVLPSALFADPARATPGWIRQMLRLFGPSVLASPVRRLAQAVCLLLFLWLFYYVCWPYNARPEEPGRVHSGWRFAEIEQASGKLRFEKFGGTAGLMSGQAVHVVDEGASDLPAGLLGKLVVAETAGETLRLESAHPLTDEQIDKLLLGAGPWAIYETEPGKWPSHYTDNLADKERLPAELFLVLDPLVSLSSAIASRSWVWSLLCAGVILLVCVLVPRGFCGYVCPFGTLIDLFDWAVSKRIKRFRLAGDGWWRNLRYHFLAGVLVAAM